MAATAALLEERCVLDLPVGDIARRAGSAPATGYHYFREVEAVARALAEEATDETSAVVEALGGPFTGSAGMARARAVVDRFFDHWDAYRGGYRDPCGLLRQCPPPGPDSCACSWQFRRPSPSPRTAGRSGCRQTSNQ
jgi:AcrR family transcriptional regulator